MEREDAKLKVGDRLQDQTRKVSTIVKHLPADGRPESWIIRSESGKERTWSTGVIMAQIEYGNWRIVP